MFSTYINLTNPKSTIHSIHPPYELRCFSSDFFTACTWISTTIITKIMTRIRCMEDKWQCSFHCCVSATISFSQVRQALWMSFSWAVETILCWLLLLLRFCQRTFIFQFHYLFRVWLVKQLWNMFARFNVVRFISFYSAIVRLKKTRRKLILIFFYIFHLIILVCIVSVVNSNCVFCCDMMLRQNATIASIANL